MPRVTIFTSNTWPYCISAKQYLSEKGVQFEEKNIQTDSSARRELISMGHRGVPVIVINGEEIVGFNKGRLDQLL